MFWCGDLNYRIELPTSLAKDHITNQRWDRISRQDQLLRQKKLNKVMCGLTYSDAESLTNKISRSG